MVCNPVPQKITHVPDFYALATCPFCREMRIVSHHDLKSTGRAVDGSVEKVYSLCNVINRQPATD